MFRSITVSSVHLGAPAQNNLLLNAIGSTDIQLRAGRSIRHIDHYGLGFFQISNRALATDLNPYINAKSYGLYVCNCNQLGSTGCLCPNATNRIYQMYQMFLNYGLIKQI